MKRRRGGTFAAVSLAAVALSLCSARTPGSRLEPIAAAGATASGTIGFWHFFTDREADTLHSVVNDFEAKYPQVKVVVNPGRTTSMSGQLYVAIDGGNSKTHVVVGSTDGRLHGFVRGPGSSPHMIGVPGTVALLDSLVRQAVAQAKLPAGTVLSRAEVYIAGADLPVEVDVLMKAVGEAGWAREHRVDNDLFALLRAGTANPDAVAVVCGAGINCVGRAADGRTARFPSLGDLSGDWGGGQHLARLALWHAARGEDGRGPLTALTPAVADYFGRSTVEDVATAIHLGELDKDRIDELSPVLFTIAAAGDEVAREVVAQQAREVVVLATIAARRLDLLDQPHAVVLGGGVLAARRPLLHNAVVEGILADAPQAQIGIVNDPPVAGAALLALDALAPADPAIESAVRAAVRAAAG